jgi:hypothetical protein
VPHYLATWGGMAYSPVEMTPVLASLAPVKASWHALHLNRGGFEAEGIVVDRGVSMRARGSRDGDPYGVQWQAWWRPIPACSTALEWL